MDQWSTASGLAGRSQTRRQSRRLTSGTVIGSKSAARSWLSSPPDGGAAQHGEVGVRQQGEGDVPVPAGPGAHLVLVEADLALGVFEAVLDDPAGAGHLHQFGERGRLGRVCQIVGEILGPGRAAPDQQALTPAWTRTAVGQIRPVIEARPLGPGTSAQALPAAGRDLGQPFLDRDLAKPLDPSYLTIGTAPMG